MRIRLAVLLSISLCPLAIGASPSPSTSPFPGCWQLRDFVLVEGGRTVSDPRWVLKLHFDPGRTFLYDSQTTQEIWLKNPKTGEATSEGRVSRSRAQGTYAIPKNGELLLEKAEGEAIQGLETQFGYDSKKRSARIETSLADGGNTLVLKGQGSRRILRFNRCQGRSETPCLMFGHPSERDRVARDPCALGS